MNRTVSYTGDDKDKYADKILKYMPGEVVAFFIPAYAHAGKLWPQCADSSCGPKWAIFAVASIGLFLYLYARAPADKPPRKIFYLLAMIAFWAWAVGTTKAGEELFGLTKGAGELVLLGAAFLIPIIDEAWTKWRPAP